MQVNEFVPKIPYGTRDFLVGEAQRKRELEANVAALFRQWGYQEVVTPTFEYLDIFENSILSEQAFKFFDREAHALTLRPDMTSPIARLAATRLREHALPKRLSYIANVFRYEQAQAGRQCEFYQAGVELLGSANAAADAEMVALAVQTVKCTGLDDFKLSLGHVDFLSGVIDSTGASEEQRGRLKALICGRDLAGLELYAKQIGLTTSKRECLQEILYLHGGKEILEKAAALADNELSETALRNLSDIHELLESYGVTEYIDFDLGLIRNLDYYTGMIFEGYTLGMGYPICGGGRYDKMMSVFGQNCPAIGFSAGIDRILLVLGRGGANEQSGAKAVYLAWREDAFAEAIAKACEMREKGRAVEVGLAPQTREQAETAANGKELVYVTK